MAGKKPTKSCPPIDLQPEEHVAALDQHRPGAAISVALKVRIDLGLALSTAPTRMSKSRTRRDRAMTTSRRLALKVKEAADALGVGRDAVYNAINRGEIRAIRFGGTLLVPQAELDRLLGVEPEGSAATVKDVLRDLVAALGA